MKRTYKSRNSPFISQQPSNSDSFGTNRNIFIIAQNVEYVNQAVLTADFSDGPDNSLSDRRFYISEGFSESGQGLLAGQFGEQFNYPDSY